MSRDLLGTRTRRPWTADEDETVRINYPHFPGFLIAHVLGRPESAVYQRAKRLGLKKAPDFWSKPIAKLWSGGRHPAARACQFRKGHVPANKGLRRPGWAPGRMGQTQFKKGRPASEPRNYVPIGTERFDEKRGVVMRKITDDPNLFPVARWRPVHVLVWESVHGPVPAGHLVTFRPGLKTHVAAEIGIDRLQLVTQAEHMRQHTLHNYPNDLKRVMQLRGALNRRINRLTKQRSAP